MLDEKNRIKDIDTKELQAFTENIQKQIQGFREISIGLSSEMRDLLKSLQTSQIEIPRIELPKFEFPKIQLPTFPKIDFERFFRDFEEECRSNAKHGWAVPSEMPIPVYRKIGRSEDNLEIRDGLFKKEFEKNNFELYNNEKIKIIENSEDGWKSLYEVCFGAIEDGKIEIAIPALFTAMEHELSNNFDSHKIGLKLIRDVKTAIVDENRVGFFSNIMGASLISLLENSIFRFDNFSSERPSIINRNRVMHGRDDPSKWSIVDTYKIITVISTIMILKN